MRPTVRDKLERKMLRMALDLAREVLWSFPEHELDALPNSKAKSMLVFWDGTNRRAAIGELTAILGDVPIDEIDVRKPQAFRPKVNPAAVRDKLNEMKRQLGLPVLKY